MVASTKRPDAAASAPSSTSGTAGRSEFSRKKTSTAHVGGPKAGSRLIAKTLPRRSSQSVKACTVRS